MNQQNCDFSRWFNELTHKYIQYRSEVLFELGADKYGYHFIAKQVDNQYSVIKCGGQLTYENVSDFSALLHEAIRQFSDFKNLEKTEILVK